MMDETIEIEIEVTTNEAKFLEDVLREYAEALRGRRHPPKGMNYGQIQDALGYAASIRAKLG